MQLLSPLGQNHQDHIATSDWQRETRSRKTEFRASFIRVTFIRGVLTRLLDSTGERVKRYNQIYKYIYDIYAALSTLYLWLKVIRADLLMSQETMKNLQLQRFLPTADLYVAVSGMRSQGTAKINGRNI